MKHDLFFIKQNLVESKSLLGEQELFKNVYALIAVSCVCLIVYLARSLSQA